MAAITPIKRATASTNGRTIIEFYGTSGAVQADTFTTPAVEAGGNWKLIEVSVPYSAAPTYTGTGLIVTVDDGRGATYDLVLTVGTDNQRYFAYLPTGEIRLLPGDAILVNTPSAGGAVVSTVSVKFLQE